MKSIIIKAMTLVALGATLFSFSPKFPQGSGSGGEGFEISLNGKVILQRYGSNMEDVKSLQLNQSSPADKLTIKYHHCGRVGKNRMVIIRDGENKVVKEWRFADAKEPVAPMNCNVKDILNLKRSNRSVVNLYYSSSELPNGRLLTSIILGNSIVVQP